jgi:hypothetical protein
VLIDGARIGRGSTAACTALLMQEPDADLGDLAGRYGASGARESWRMSRLAVGAFVRYVDTLARCTACGMALVGLLHPAG